MLGLNRFGLMTRVEPQVRAALESAALADHPAQIQVLRPGVFTTVSKGGAPVQWH